jgi:hypothetical protein
MNTFYDLHVGAHMKIVTFYSLHTTAKLVRTLQFCCQRDRVA